MIPGLDDFYVEKGKFVWTEKFLLNRGYCCNNNCRHCPYKKDENDSILLENIKQPDLQIQQKETFWLSLIVD